MINKYIYNYIYMNNVNTYIYIYDVNLKIYAQQARL